MAIQQRAGFAENCKELVAHLGSARRWRAVFGGPPKRCRDASEHGKRREEMILRHIHEEPFDEPSNGARQRRALPGSGTLLARCIIGRLISFGCGGNYLDLY